MSETVRMTGNTEAWDHHQRKPWWWEEPGHRKGPWVMVDMGAWRCVCECGASRIWLQEDAKDGFLTDEGDDEA